MSSKVVCEEWTNLQLEMYTTSFAHHRSITLGFPCRRCRFEDLYFDPDGALQQMETDAPAREQKASQRDGRCELIGSRGEKIELKHKTRSKQDNDWREREAKSEPVENVYVEVST